MSLIEHGLRKVRLEGEKICENGGEGGPVVVKMESESCSRAGSEGHEEVDFNAIEFKGMSQGQKSPCSCQQEIKSLKRTVNKLSDQIDKQNDAFRKQGEVICGMKLCLRNVGLSLMNFCRDEQQVIENGQHGSTGNLAEFTENEQAAPPVAVDNGLFNNSEVVTSSGQITANQDNQQDKKNLFPLTIVNCTGNYSSSLGTPSGPVIASSVSPETIGQNFAETSCHSVDEENVAFQDNHNEMETGSVFCQKIKEEEIGDDVNFEEECGESFFVLEDESEEDSSQEEKYDKNNSNEASNRDTIKSVKRKKGGTSTKRYKCHLCTKVFSVIGRLKEHIQSAHEGVRYKCTKCPGTFARLGDVNRHEKKIHQVGGPPTRSCDICGTHLLNSEQSLARHMSHIHKRLAAETRECAYCPAKFSKRREVRCHEMRIHSEGRPTQECKLCGVHLLDSQSSLRSHMIKKHNESGYDTTPIKPIVIG